MELLLARKRVYRYGPTRSGLYIQILHTHRQANIIFVIYVYNYPMVQKITEIIGVKEKRQHWDVHIVGNSEDGCGSVTEHVRHDDQASRMGRRDLMVGDLGE